MNAPINPTCDGAAVRWFLVLCTRVIRTRGEPGEQIQTLQKQAHPACLISNPATTVLHCGPGLSPAPE